MGDFAQEPGQETRRIPGPRRWATTVFRIAVSAGLLGFLFSRIPVAQVLEALGRIDFRYAAAVFATALAVQFLVSHRLKLIAAAQGIQVSLFRALEINLSAAFYGLFVPGGNLSRGAIRAYKLYRQSGQLVAATASTVFDRLVATAALGVVGQLFWLLDWPLTTVPIGIAFVALWIGPVAAHQTLRFEGVRTGIKRWLDRTGLRSVRMRWLAGTTLRDSLRRLEQMSLGRWSSILTASVLAQILSCLSYYLLAVGLSIEVSFIQIAWISMATTGLTMLPISPSGIGVREGALVVLLGQYGVPGASALALSFMVFICTILIVGLLGGVLEARSWIRPRMPSTGVL